MNQNYVKSASLNNIAIHLLSATGCDVSMSPGYLSDIRVPERVLLRLLV
jgi:hypothetical protein|uniref:Uncharacterized protein n=1 Tax=Picea glauca TaxID=3330 RepID=A0A101LXS9_PICGL|nr:hypothetical protein ABT39_MTgene5507 [Picea glauca]